MIALSVREDVASCLGILGVFLLLTGSAALEGAVLSVVGGGYFIVMKLGRRFRASRAPRLEPRQRVRAPSRYV
jgi:hypothetical protein